MAKGHEIHQARTRALQLLGRDLARRAKSKCELTGAAGVSLTPYEVPPVPAEPDPERILLVSAPCLAALERPGVLATQGREWHCLAETVWAELPAAQVVAWRMLQVLARHEDWARNALEGAALDDDTLHWAASAPLPP